MIYPALGLTEVENFNLFKLKKKNQILINGLFSQVNLFGFVKGDYLTFLLKL